MVKHDVLSTPGASWSYRANALYDLAAAKVLVGFDRGPARPPSQPRADHPIFQRVLLRRPPARGDRLQAAETAPTGRRCDGSTSRGGPCGRLTGGAINQEEAAAVVAELRRLALEQRFSGEMGVVTPFRAQANLIEELIARDDALAAVLASRNFISETAHRFQGDERDLIYSRRWFRRHARDRYRLPEKPGQHLQRRHHARSRRVGGRGRCGCLPVERG